MGGGGDPVGRPWRCRTWLDRRAVIMISLALNGDSRATAWMSRAACTQADPEIFFPAPGDEVGEAKAKAVCRACPVRSECLAYAVVHGIDDGVWGGTSEERRRAIRRQPISPVNGSAHHWGQ